MTTEARLRDWRFGQTHAERLCSALLHIEGFDDVDPQAPLGGPDGKKDLLCTRAGRRWVAAAYFPPTHQTFEQIKEKFSDDFVGVKRNAASGFIFIVNQPLTVGERTKLGELAGDVAAEIYHLERIRGVLDSPKGYGARLEFLRIPMTPEEQLALWSALNYDLVRRLLDNESRFERLEAKLDLVLKRTTAMSVDLHQQRSSIENSRDSSIDVETPMAQLTLPTLCWVHRILTDDGQTPEVVRGRLRSIQVWIGTRDQPSLMLPPPEEVVDRTRDLLAWWQLRYQEIAGQEKESVVQVLAEFHHRILSIHPFLDGNGRVARALLGEAAHELLNMRVSRELIADPSAYFEALNRADQGELAPLVRLISSSLE